VKRRARLAPEALEGLRVFREVIGKELEDDETTELGVLSFVNDAHASAAQFFEDAIVREGLADA